jgi:methylated-DNA-[protein]-cysteine S-methyltransferase
MKKYYAKISQFDLIITEDNRSIVGIDFGKSDDREISPIIEQCMAELHEYFRGERESFDVKINLNGTEFQKSVWEELRKIPYGKVRSYKEIAVSVGCPKGARAVGNANNKNPIPIIVPCHRVIACGGKIGGYAGGIELKKKLLKIENYLIDP